MNVDGTNTEIKIKEVEHNRKYLKDSVEEKSEEIFKNILKMLLIILSDLFL